ncbi:MAG: hypothetical protein ACRDVM_08520 [Acidimicrobiia bacterium]
MVSGLLTSLRKRLIPTRHPSWREFADRVGGEFRQARWWRSDEVVTRVGDWLVHLDTVMLDPESGVLEPGRFYSSRRGTQAWADFHSLDAFQFIARDRKWLHGVPGRLQWDIDLGRLMDAIGGHDPDEDLELGEPSFDEHFVVRANDPAKLKALVAETSLLATLAARPALAEIRIAIAGKTGDPSPRPASLILWEREMWHDPDALMAIQGLLVGLLDRLAAIGSAGPYNSRP